MKGLPTPADFPCRIVDNVRYSDTDRQGHVNNIAFAVFLEAGRVELLFGGGDLLSPGCAFVLARTEIDYRGELNWPGRVEVGTRVERIGRSSVAIRQALFQDGRCAAEAHSVMVQLGQASKGGEPLNAVARERLGALMRLAD